jgi:hypothetical protein
VELKHRIWAVAWRSCFQGCFKTSGPSPTQLFCRFYRDGLPAPRTEDSETLKGLKSMPDSQPPTATELLKRELMRFLSNKEPEVLCIRGAWGVGKTYAWNKFLAEAKSDDLIALSKYA